MALWNTSGQQDSNTRESNEITGILRVVTDVEDGCIGLWLGWTETQSQGGGQDEIGKKVGLAQRAAKIYARDLDRS